MLILAIDTTTRFGSVALVNSGQLLAEVNYLAPASHSRQVFRAVDEVLRVAARKFDDLEGLAVAAGPGSFTGIRIGLSLVKALALASGKKVVSVSSLEALAHKLLFSGAELIVPMIDARKGEIFACAYSLSVSGLQETISAGVYRPEAFLNLIPSRKSVAFIGTGGDLYRSLILEKLGSGARFLDRTYHLAAEVGMIGEKRLEKGLGLSPKELQPIYYRKSQAEEKKH
ncbi:MAG: tRNA (adenosine(37)-N6)-threonylcarbamoyltransferase complex dimerization subunit type 1 TsaB [Candidatus Saccharicenans sp.]